MDTRSLAQPSEATPTEQERLEKLKERYRHELMDEVERLELRERVLRLRRKFSERELSERG